MWRLLLFLLVAPSAHAAPSDTFTLFAYPPRHELNFDTPSSLLFSMLEIQFERLLSSNEEVLYTDDFGESGTISSNFKSVFGHTAQRIDCTLPDGSRFLRWTSMTGNDNSAFTDRNVFSRQLGFGAFFYDYPDGHVAAGEPNWKALVHYRGVQPRYIQFHLNPEACARVQAMVLFFESFHVPPGTSPDELERRDSNSVLFFSLISDPWIAYQRRLLGHPAKISAGCTSYTMALLKNAALFDPEFDRFFRRRVTLSEALIGGVPDARNRGTRRVSVYSVLLGELGQSWFHPGHQNLSVSFYDPRYVWSFVGAVSECLRGSEGCAPVVHSWLQSHPQVRVGPLETLRDQVTKTRTTPRGVRYRYKATVENEFEGIVIP